MLFELTEKYNEPHRHYHNLTHIAHMFQTAKRWGVTLSKTQQLAIWYHDAVYDPMAQDNEEKSVELYEKWIALEPKESVSKIILDTKTHKPTSEESKLVLDLDMAILGEKPIEYRRYAKQIAKEFSFARDMNGVDMYSLGRIKFLHEAIQDAKENKLYFTSEGQALNANAIRNMEWEINKLNQGKL